MNYKTKNFLKVIPAMLIVLAVLASSSSACTCHHGRFDLDRFDRSFVPSMQLFSIMVLDANGNRIARLGRYGNADSKGPGSLVPNPDLGFAWVRSVGVSDKAMYAMDYGNKRVVKADLDYNTNVYLNLDGTPSNALSKDELQKKQYVLHQNNPNPFNPATTISYEIPEKSKVVLTIFSLNGKVVKKLVNGVKEAGRHNFRLDASRLTSGVYIYELKAGSFVQRRKMALLR